MASEANVLTISFEIAWEDTDQGRSEYNSIYNKLNEAIQANLSASDWWSENTSYYVVRTNESASGLLGRVWRAAKMRSSKDRIVVLDANVKTGAAFGNFGDKTIFRLIPYLTLLPPEKK